MRILLKAVVILTLVLLGSCARRPPAGPLDVNQQVPSTQANPSVCDVARDVRKQAATLYATGRLERTVRALRKANRLCHEEASSSTELLQTALALLGHADKDASVMPLAEADQLLRQGLLKKAKGDPIEAQKLFDRALVSLERVLSSKAELKVENGIWNVSAAAWSRDGSKLVVASGQNIHVLYAESGERMLNLQTESGPISTLAIRPDSSVLASGSPNRDLVLWSLGSSDFGTRIGTLPHSEGDLQTLVFSPDGKTLAGRTWESASSILWNVELRRPLRTLEAIYRDQVVVGIRSGDHGGGWPAMLAYSPDGASLLVVHHRTLAVWDLRSQKSGISKVLRVTDPRLAKDTFDSVAFHPNGRQFVTGTDLGKLVVWSLAGGAPRVVQAHLSRPLMVFSRDGERLLSAAIDGSVRTFTTRTLKPLGAAQVPWPSVEAVAPHPDTRRAAFASQGRINIEDVSSNKHLKAIRPPLALSAVAMNKSGTALAFGTPSGAMVLISLRDGSFVWLHGHATEVKSLAFSPNGQSLVSVSLDKTARVWDLRTHKSQRVLDHPQMLHSVAFHPDGQVFATGGDKGILRVWDAQSGGLLASPKGMVCAVDSLMYSHDGKLLIANASDHAVSRWDTSRYTALPRRQTNHGCVAEVQASSSTLGLMGDGSLIASAPNGNEIELLNAQTGQWHRTLPAGGLVRSLAVRPGDSVLAAAVGEGIRRWQLPGGTELPGLTTDDPSSPVDSFVFSADGRFLVGISLRGTVSVWSMPSGTLLLTLRWTDETSAFATTSQGLSEWLGPGKPATFCQIGVRIYPRELCEDRVWTPGLLSKIFLGQESQLTAD